MANNIGPSLKESGRGTLPGRNYCPQRLLLSGLAPLFRQGFVREYLDVHATDHRAGLEALLFSYFSVVPVGQGDARGAFIDPMADGVEQGIPVCGLIGEGCGPNLPVELGVVPAVVEGQAVTIEVLEVKGDFGATDGG